jgi:hypothetical protein
METLEDHWDDPGRGGLSSMHGRLANALQYEASTLGLFSSGEPQRARFVPRFVFADDVNHPLAQEQRNGTPWHQVARINHELHG